MGPWAKAAIKAEATPAWALGPGSGNPSLRAGVREQTSEGTAMPGIDCRGGLMVCACVLAGAAQEISSDQQRGTPAHTSLVLKVTCRAQLWVQCPAWLWCQHSVSSRRPPPVDFTGEAKVHSFLHLLTHSFTLPLP